MADAAMADATAPKETPEERLERLEEELDARDDVSSPEFLALSAKVAKEGWIVARRKARKAKEEEKNASEEGSKEEKEAAREKVELTQAEAKLAEAEAELAQAKAEGWQTDALDSKVASFQAEVTRIKTVHRRPPPDEPASKRQKPTHLVYSEPQRNFRYEGTFFDYQPGDVRLCYEAAIYSWEYRAMKSKDYCKAISVIGGMGTGKSRALDEMKGMLERQASLCAADAQRDAQKRALDREFLCALKDAWVFKVNFENGVGFIKDYNNAYVEVGVRMGYQLQDSEDVPFSIFATDEFNRRHAVEVIRMLLDSTEEPNRPKCIILLVDGLHSFGDKYFEARSAVCSIPLEVTEPGVLVLPIFAATRSVPAAETKTNSNTVIVNYEPPMLDGHAAIPSEDPLVRMMVDDAGGHGRVLQELMTVLSSELGMDAYESMAAAGSVTLDGREQGATRIYRQYTEAVRRRYSSMTEEIAHSVVAAVLSRRTFVSTDSLVDAKRALSVNTVRSYGLVRVVRGGEHLRLECPFALMFMAASERRLERSLALSFLSPQRFVAAESQHAPGFEAFERFVADFAALRQGAYADAGEPVPWRVLQAGALFGKKVEEGERELAAPETRLVCTAREVRTAAEQTATAGTALDGFFSDRPSEHRGRYVFVNAASAPVADVFYDVSDERGGTRYVAVQAKNYSPGSGHAHNLGSILSEVEKGAPAGGFFVFISRGKLVSRGNGRVEDQLSKLPRGVAVVGVEQFDDYFGFAGKRAYWLASAGQQ